jgi:hypothetical protein
MACFFVHCSLCGMEGHNRRTCGRKPRSSDPAVRRAWARAYLARIRALRRSRGICPCGGVPEEGYASCRDCRLDDAKRKRRWRERRMREESRA